MRTVMQTVNVPFKSIFCLLFATALMMAPKTVLADQDLAKASQNCQRPLDCPHCPTQTVSVV